MTTQLKLPINEGTAQEFEPPAFLKPAIERFAASRGGSYSDTGLATQQVDPMRGHAQYLAYRNSIRTATEDLALRNSYGHLRQELGEQYGFMTKPASEGGLGIQVETTPYDPYHTAAEMAQDVATNHRVRVMATDTTGPHAFLSNEENDQFRAVHDVLGHAATGRGFSRNGEEAAYLAHSQLFSPQARSALASETRGQNSYLNYGPGGFPEQGAKLVGMPAWANEAGPYHHLSSGQFDKPDLTESSQQGSLW